MGALTAKTKQFTYRTWEQKSFVEIDETEVTLNTIRSEKLKLKQIRYLPLNYWISDKRRFTLDKSLNVNPIIFFNGQRTFNPIKIFKAFFEKKLIRYMVSNNKAYTKIINKYLNSKTKQITCYSAKKLALKLESNRLLILNDLLYKKSKEQKTFISYETDMKSKEIILLINPRVESPTFQVFLYKSADMYTFTSFSAFSSNIKMLQIPLTSYNLISTLEGSYNISNKTLIISFLDNSRFSNFNSTISLTPLYVIKSSLTYPTEKINDNSFILSTKNKALFRPVVVKPHSLHNNKNGEIVQMIFSINYNKFELFLLKRVNIKFIYRLLLLFCILRPRNKQNIYRIQYTINTIYTLSKRF